jgi:hypothetical protein
MKKTILIALAFVLLSPSQAWAHTPLELRTSDTTASSGPLITDGTVTFAVKAAFTEKNQTKAFRAAFKKGDRINVKYLIADTKAAKAIKSSDLPTLTITSPSGVVTTMKLSKAKKYFERGTKANYLNLGEFTSAAEAGTYSFNITAKRKSTMTVSIGEKYKVKGKVTR